MAHFSGAGAKRQFEDPDGFSSCPAKIAELSSFIDVSGSTSQTGGTCEVGGASLQASAADWCTDTSVFSARHNLPATLTSSHPEYGVAEVKGSSPIALSQAIRDAMLSPSYQRDKETDTPISQGGPQEQGSAGGQETSASEASSPQTPEDTVSVASGSSSTTSVSTNTPTQDSVSLYKKRMLHYRRYDKPPYSYLGIVIVAIQYSPAQALTLAEVIKVLPKMFSFFSGTYRGWRDSIRHNLSANKCFKKAPEHLQCRDGRRRGVRWMVDWERVPEDVFKLQVGRPGSKDPHWKPTLQQYLGLPDVQFPANVSDVSGQVPQGLTMRSAAASHDTYGDGLKDGAYNAPALVQSLGSSPVPAAYHDMIRITDNMSCMGAGSVLHSSLAHGYPLTAPVPWCQPLWFDNIQVNGVDLSNKTPAQKPADKEHAKLPTTNAPAGPQATSTPDPKRHQSGENENRQRQLSPDVDFPDIISISPSEPPLPGLPAVKNERGEAVSDRQLTGVPSVSHSPTSVNQTSSEATAGAHPPPTASDVTANRFRHPSALSEHNFDRSRHFSGPPDTSLSRSRHLSAMSDQTDSRSRHPSAMSSSSDQGYFTSEDSLNQASTRYNYLWDGYHQPAPTQYGHTPASLPTLPPPPACTTTASCLSPWHHPSYTFPFLHSTSQALAMQQSAATAATHHVSQYGSIHSAPHGYHHRNLLHPAMQSGTEGFPGYMIHSTPAVSPYQYDPAPAYRPCSQYPLSGQSTLCHPPPPPLYPYPQNVTSPAGIHSAMVPVPQLTSVGVCQNSSASGKTDHRTHLLPASSSSCSQNDKPTSAADDNEQSTVSISLLPAHVATQHSTSQSSSQILPPAPAGQFSDQQLPQRQSAQQPATLGLSALSNLPPNSPHSLPNLKYVLPQPNLSFSPEADHDAKFCHDSSLIIDIDC